ncbi:tyrosine-type recombinase/integrase [Pseudoxanthomonas sp.]|uniref:tyrosine-type recombinase/integrase n=1 Tax=Pseudoxanthomonas sp. TaxID=1871049 RepID=UPI003F8090EA
MFQRRGAYYFVKDGKWHPLGRDYGAALTKYAAFVGTQKRVRTIKDAMWSAIEHGKTRKHKRPLSKATIDNYQHSAARTGPVFGHMELEDLDAHQVTRYVISQGTVQANRDKAFISLTYTHARVMHDYRGPDPTKRLQLRNEEKPRDRYVTDDELETLINAASPKLGCIARFIGLTGMRQGDVLRLKMSDLDDEGFTYWNTKSRKWQGLEWSDELRRVVDDAKRLWRQIGREWLFESRPKGKHSHRGVGPYTPGGLRALWRAARDKAAKEDPGVADVRLHGLRAKAGSDKATDEEAQALLGHSDSKVTRRHYRRKVQRQKPSR